MSFEPVDFSSLLSEFVSGDLSEAENSVWLVYAAVIVETISSASHVAQLWEYISSEVTDDTKQLKIARRLREGLLKTSPLAGFPKGINCLAALRKAVKETSPSVGKKYEADKPLRAELSAEELQRRGEAFFDRVYAKVASRVKENMGLSSGGDLNQFALLSIYGELMAEERILSAKETGLMEFVVCYASSTAPQAKGHMYGSRNLGNGRVEIQKAIKLVHVMAMALKFPLDTDSMRFVAKVDNW